MRPNFKDNELIPAIVQDFHTGKVLMLAYMNEESYDISLKEGRTCFYSRSRQELWRKGETSGHTQKIMSMKTDCDQDTILIQVEQKGSACHHMVPTCFDLDKDEFFSLDYLYAYLVKRKEEDKEGSYTSYLFREGLNKILKKVGEESTEVVIAAKEDDRDELIYEIADLVFHLQILMIEKDISNTDITNELAKRHE